MDATALADRFARAGLDAPAAQAKAAMFARLAEHLAKQAGVSPARALAFFVPGRVEVLGKHTDYAGGSTLVMAVDRGFCLLVHPRSDNQVRLFNVAQNEQACSAIDPDLSPQMGHWMNYPQTVVRRLARNFPQARCGADIAFLSDLPRSSGMSSSSAMIVAIYLALAAVNRIEQLPAYQHNIASQDDLAGYLGTIENGQTFGTLAGDRGVGTFGGSEDHTAILRSQPGRLSQYRYCPVRLERRIALPDDLRFLIAFSGAHAEKTGGARELYNRASLLAQQAAQAWRQATGREDAHLAAALASAPDAPQQLRRILADQPDLLQRFEHFYAESEQILPAAGDALERGDLAEFGKQVDRSQDLTERLLGNQVPQTVHLARSARRLGALAASAFGAGFGGSVWALARQADADALLQAWEQDYRAAFPADAAHACFFATRPGPAAMRISD